MLQSLARAMLATVAVGMLPACDDGLPPCGTVQEIRPATGAGAVENGALSTGATDQSVAISADRQRLEYTFTLDGKRYTAVYALSETQAPPAHRAVSIRRATASLDCATLKNLGPVVDGIEIRRHGRMLANGGSTLFPGPCSGTMSPGKGPAALNGSPDGQGVSLSTNVFSWSLPWGNALIPGDEISITVLGTSADPYVVHAIADADEIYPLIELGKLTGSGTVTVP
jgi:hypothetical protein